MTDKKIFMSKSPSKQFFIKANKNVFSHKINKILQ